MGKVCLKPEQVKARIVNACKYVWAMKSAGKKVTASSISKEFHIGPNGAKIIVETITADTNDIMAVSDNIYTAIKDENRKQWAAYRAKCEAAKSNEEPPKFLDPEMPAPEVESPQEVDIRKIRSEIREEILDEISQREKEHKRSVYEAVSRECLYRLVSVCPRWTAKDLADKAEDIARRFIQIVYR